MNSRRTRTIAVFGLLFAAAGAVVGFLAFMSGIGDTGYPAPSLRTVILGTLALWPEYLCGRASLIGNLELCNRLRALGDRAPLLYLFGIPIAGWGSIGTLIGYWRARHL
jgi:uncharacterized membrane protein